MVEKEIFSFCKQIADFLMSNFEHTVYMYWVHVSLLSCSCLGFVMLAVSVSPCPGQKIIMQHP